MALTKDQKDEIKLGLGMVALILILFFIFRSRKGSSFAKSKSNITNNRQKQYESNFPPPPPPPSVTIYGGGAPYGYPYGYQGGFGNGWGGAGLFDPLTIAYEDMMLQGMKPKVCRCGKDKDGRNITCDGKMENGKLVCSCCGGK